MKSILIVLMIAGAVYGVREGWFEVNWPLMQSDVQQWMDGFNRSEKPE